jgi:hypothetical protein
MAGDDGDDEYPPNIVHCLINGNFGNGARMRSRNVRSVVTDVTVTGRGDEIDDSMEGM